MPYEYVVAFVYCASLFMQIMDSTIVNVALETLARDLHTGTSSIEWVVVGYLMSLAMWVPASGWISDRFGTRKVFFSAIMLFSIGSLLCALSQSLAMLVVARVIQGLGGALTHRQYRCQRSQRRQRRGKAHRCRAAEDQQLVAQRREQAATGGVLVRHPAQGQSRQQQRDTAAPAYPACERGGAADRARDHQRAPAQPLGTGSKWPSHLHAASICGRGRKCNARPTLVNGFLTLDTTT